MTRDELLTELAMELKEWPSSLTDVNEILPPTWTRAYGPNGMVYLNPHNTGICSISEQEWLARRAELINEPDDSEAPWWASWKAQDGYGKWHWYIEKPILPDNEEWFLGDHDHAYPVSIGKIPAGHDWKATPKEIKRDAAEHGKAEQINSPKYYVPTGEWRGQEDGLPPVGSVCEYKYGGEKAHIVAHHMDGEQAIWCESSEGGELFYGTADDFLPINSEREQWISLAKDTLDENVSALLSEVTLEQIADLLYDAGLARLPE